MNKIMAAFLFATMLTACKPTEGLDATPQPKSGNSSADIADCAPEVESAIKDAMIDQRFGRKTEYDVKKAGEYAMDSCMQRKGY